MAEIINIGMGDDAAEAEAFLFPYCKKEVVNIRMEQLLPEFEHTVQMDYEKQPKETWIAWLWPTLFYVLFAIVVTAAGMTYMPKYSKWIPAGAAFVSIWILLLVVAYYHTAGSCFSEEEMVLVKGYFSKTYCFVPYKKIQYVELKQNLPYFPEKDGEIIKERIIQAAEIR